MRKIALISGVVVAGIVLAGIVLWYVNCQHADRTGKSQATVPVSTVRRAQLPPEPDVSLDINSETELEAHQGIPLLLTVRLANQRAANAQTANAANEAIAAGAREQLKTGTITAAESQAREAFTREREEVPTLVLPADWPKSIHFQIRRANDPDTQTIGPFH